MEQNKDNPKEKEHNVETPSPPQVMDPSKSPQKGESENENISDKGSSSKRAKKGKNRKLAPNEEL